MVKPKSVHHIAVCTANMKAQIEFFTDVMGMELVGLYWMHGAEGCWHGFLKLNDTCSLAFVFTPDTPDKKPIEGITHAGNPANGAAPGTIQHIAFNVDTVDEMLNLRDRIRSRGVNIIGPIDHGMCQSMYFAGPENLTLEIATSEVPITPDLWIDPEVVELAGISEDELKRYISPDPYEGQGGKVAQPEKDESKPHMEYAAPLGDGVLRIPDDVLKTMASFPAPPGAAK